MIKSKKQSFIVVGVFALVLMLGTVTYAFFNYTRTGTANTIRTGRISFNTSQSNTLNLTNVFPMSATDAENANLDAVSVRIWGDTTYADGEEFEISIVDVNNTIGSGQSAKTIPINYIASYSATPVQLGDPNVIGTNSDSYFTARGQSSPVYQLSATGEATNGEQVLIGFIPSGATGIDGTLTIKAYLDSSKIAISDTYNDGNTPTDNMGTPASFGEGKTVLTTTEWNSLQQNGVSFKIKVEGNEGIWIPDSNPPAGEILLSRMSTKTACTTTAVNNAGIGGIGDVTYFIGAENSTTEDCLTNYVWYSGKLWRITAVYPDGTIKLVTENPMTSIYFGSDSTFNNSYVDQWLSQEFLPTLYNYQNIIVQNAEWNVAMTTDPTIDLYLLDGSTTINKTVGLLNAFELDKTIVYNEEDWEYSSYLFINDEWWLMNPYNSYDLWYSDRDTKEGLGVSNAVAVRPSVYLKSSVSFTNINETDAGKRSNPYRINGDKTIGTKGESLNQRLSGEYVKLTDSNSNDLLYRIVGIENGKTKIVSTSCVENPNSRLGDKTRSLFGIDKYYNTPSSTNEYWNNYLTDTTNGWVNTLSTTTRSMLETGTYYLGYYSDGGNYKQTICATYDTNTSTSSCTRISDSALLYTGMVGLLRGGEMMATFQSSTTTHSYNTTFNKEMWLITPSEESWNSSIGCVNRSGYSYCTGYSGVSPTLHLKSGVTITGGTGTALDPYSLALTS